MPKYVLENDLETGRRVYGWLYGPFIVPAGTECAEATNLPPENPRLFWVRPWEGMPDSAANLIGTEDNPGYGLLIDEGDGVIAVA